MVARGLTNAEIAQTLLLGEATIKTHVSNILVKLDPPRSSPGSRHHLRNRADPARNTRTTGTMSTPTPAIDNPAVSSRPGTKALRSAARTPPSGSRDRLPEPCGCLDWQPSGGRARDGRVPAARQLRGQPDGSPLFAEGSLADVSAETRRSSRGCPLVHRLTRRVTRCPRGVGASRRVGRDPEPAESRSPESVSGAWVRADRLRSVSNRRGEC